MKRWFAGSVVLALLASIPLLAQSKAKAANVPEIPYDSVPNFLKLPPTLYLGEGIGVAAHSKGHVSGRLIGGSPEGAKGDSPGHRPGGMVLYHVQAL